MGDDDAPEAGGPEPDAPEPDAPEPGAPEPGAPEPDAPAGRRGRGLSTLAQALIAGGVMVAMLGGLGGWLGYQSYQQHAAEQLRQRLIQVGRQGAVNLTTIDYQHADADVQRILDSASGQFYDEFSARSAPFIEVVKKAQSKSVGTVTEAGIESLSGREAQVLVAVSVTTTNQGAPDERPRYWRMRLTVTQHDSDTKVSKVEFVP